MKLQASIPGQMSGLLPNQSGSGGVPPSTINMDPEFLRARTAMQEKIYDILIDQLKQHPVTEVHRRKFKDFAKCLEEDVLKDATSKEDYLNMGALNRLLRKCIRWPSLNDHN